MPRFIARWTIAAAAAGLIALPAAAFAQSTGSAQPPSQPAASQSATAPAADQSATTPADHVRQAKQALDNVPRSSIPSADRAKFAQLRAHLNKLERDVASQGAASARPSAKKATTQWASDLTAIDKLVTELAGPENGNASAPSATGTTGTAASSSSAAATAKSAQLDEQAQSALDKVRQHMAAVAAELSGTAAPASTVQNQATGSSTASAADTMGTPPSSASQAAPPNSAQSSSSTQSAATGSQSTTPPAQTGTQSSATQPPAAGSQPPSSAAPQASQPSQPQGDQVDASAAKQHLTEARDTLSSLTTMPEAAKLQGEARTGVSQLISDFNALITTQLNWRDSDQKVEADLNKLLGSENGEPAPATSAGAIGTTGSSGSAATGTTGAGAPPAGAAASPQPSAAAGAVQLDPAIRSKLVEFRSHLKDFEKAAGGVASASSPAAAPASATSSTMNPTVSTGSTSNPANPATGSSASAATSATAGATGTTGTNPPAAAGTTGTSAPTGAAAASSATSSTLANRDEVQRHLDAIQSLLSQAKDGKLDKAQTDQLKSEVQQLRQLLGQSK